LFCFNLIGNRIKFKLNLLSCGAHKYSLDFLSTSDVTITTTTIIKLTLVALKAH